MTNIGELVDLLSEGEFELVKLERKRVEVLAILSGNRSLRVILELDPLWDEMADAKDLKARVNVQYMHTQTPHDVVWLQEFNFLKTDGGFESFYTVNGEIEPEPASDVLSFMDASVEPMLQALHSLRIPLVRGGLKESDISGLSFNPLSIGNPFFLTPFEVRSVLAGGVLSE